jgi:hypothetical protein
MISDVGHPKVYRDQSLPQESPRQRERLGLKDLEWQENIEPKWDRELYLTPMWELDWGWPKSAGQCCTQPQLWTMAWPCHDVLSLPSRPMGKVNSTYR